MSEKLTGIIRRPAYGLRDCSKPVLWFDVYVSESLASLQVFSGKEADKIIMDAKVHDVKDLEGMPCWVEKSPGLMKFIEMWRV